MMPIESKIRNNKYQCPSDLMADITQLKNDFGKSSDSRCKERELIFSQECEKLVFKGMESLYIS